MGEGTSAMLAMIREGLPPETIVRAISPEARGAMREFLGWTLAVVVLDLRGASLDDGDAAFQERHVEYARQLARVVLALSSETKDLGLT
jgi:hypothetical protein